MEQKLSLKERFLLLAIDDAHGELVHENTSFLLGFCATVVYEMMILQFLYLEKGKLIFKPLPLTDNCHRLVRRKLKQIHHPPSLSHFFGLLYKQAPKLKKIVLAQLQEKKIVLCSRKRLWGIIPIKTYPTLQKYPELRLRKYLKILATENRTPDEESYLLFLLLEQCDLLAEVFGESRKQDIVAYVHQLKFRLYSQQTEKTNAMAILDAIKETSLFMIIKNG